ncbi:hypothetical protein ACJX0J_041077, partial [Zea mays]
MTEKASSKKNGLKKKYSHNTHGLLYRIAVGWIFGSRNSCAVILIEGCGLYTNSQAVPYPYLSSHSCKGEYGKYTFLTSYAAAGAVQTCSMQHIVQQGGGGGGG